MTANKWLLSLMVPAALAVSLGACNQPGGATQPGYVNTSAAGSYPGSSSGDPGRVMAIREVPVRGGGSGMSNGTVIGGGLGAAGGAAIGAATTNSIGGALIGGLLGAVGGAIAGTAISSSGGGSQRGIEVTVQKDDGQTVVIAQADNGDVQMGDRVRIVQDRNGVASAVRDSGYRRDL
jgi:outer membrane lipoprotein SlyB